MKVLVVDDSATMRRIIIRALNGAGIEDASEASDGKEATAAVDQDEFGLVLMDWNMPNMSGLEALTAIRAQGSKVPVVMVTTEAEKSRVIDAMKAGANDYLIKPFTPDKMMEKIQKFF